MDRLPDERVMGGQAGGDWRARGREYLGREEAWKYPPPLRWGWCWVVGWPRVAGWAGWVMAVVGAWVLAGHLAAVLVLSSPLAWVARGRVLADTAVGGVWLVGVLAAPAHPWAVGVAAVVMLGMKEGSL